MPLDDILPERRGRLQPNPRPNTATDDDAPPPDFSGVANEPTGDQLQLLRQMAQTLREKIAAAAKAEEVLERVQADLANFQIVVIPQAMELAGITSFKLEDGSELFVKPDLKCSIPKEDLNKREECFTWLRSNGHGGVIKTSFDVDVRPLTEVQRKQLMMLLQRKGLTAVVKDDVHWQTLKSLMSELLEQGTTPPPSFSIHQFKKAGLKAPKA